MKIDYYAYQSKMRNWNSGIKVLFAVGTLFLAIFLNRIWVSVFIVLSMGTLTLFVGKTPWKVYRHFMMVPLTFIILSTAVIALQCSKSPVGEWNLSLGIFYLCLTKKSLMLAVQVFFKVVAGISALYMMAFSTPMNELILVLQKLHLPKMLVELMNLIYRYIFILFDVAEQMQTSAKARLGYGNFRQSCKTFAGIAGNLFLISLKKANTYYDALLSRAYDGNLRFLTEEIPIKGWQILGCAGYFAVLILIGAVA